MRKLLVLLASFSNFLAIPSAVVSCGVQKNEKQKSPQEVAKKVSEIKIIVKNNDKPFGVADDKKNNFLSWDNLEIQNLMKSSINDWFKKYSSDNFFSTTVDKNVGDNKYSVSYSTIGSGGAIKSEIKINYIIINNNYIYDLDEPINNDDTKKLYEKFIVSDINKINNVFISNLSFDNDSFIIRDKLNEEYEEDIEKGFNFCHEIEVSDKNNLLDGIRKLNVISNYKRDLNKFRDIKAIEIPNNNDDDEDQLIDEAIRDSIKDNLLLIVDGSTNNFINYEISKDKGTCNFTVKNENIFINSVNQFTISLKKQV